MDRRTTFVLLTLGFIAGAVAVGVKRKHDLKKARALRASYRPRFNNGCYLVKITEGPAWSLGEFGTYDAAENKVLIEGEEFDADQFQFILA